MWSHESLSKQPTSAVVLASFPDSPTLECKNFLCEESLVSFSREHDVIEIGPKFLEQKDVLCIVQTTMHSALSMYGVVPPTARYL